MTVAPSNAYYGNVNPDLLAAIPLSALRVLELGAGAGALGAAFKRRNPKTFWCGIECVAHAAQQAGERLDAVFHADVEQVNALPWGDWQGQWDVVVCGDVLEHLRDPWAILLRLSQSLRAGGIFLACVPNIGHWSVIQALLEGRFDYTEQGLLDRTHLRFFTAPSIISLVQGAGLEPLSLRARPFALNQEGFEAFFTDLAPWVARHSKAAQGLRERLLSLQYVVRARRHPPLEHHQQANPTETARGMPRLVIAMVAMAPGFADVRTRIPLAAFASLAEVQVHYFERSAAIPDIDPAIPKVVVVQRHLPDTESSWLEMVARLSAKGWLVLAEWDDHPDLFAPSIRQNFDRAPWASVKGAHGVITTTQTLAEVICAVRGDDRVLVFENQLLELPAQSVWQVQQERLQGQAQGLIRVFYGALNRSAEGVALMKALAPVFERHKQLELLVLQDKLVFEAAAIKQKHFEAACNYQSYHRLLSSAQIALMPLAPGLPNACKSDLKFVECASHGMAIIASETVYARVIRNGHNGLLAKDVESFSQALERLAAEPLKAKTMGECAREEISQRRLWSHCLEARVDALVRAWTLWRHS